MRLDPLSDRLRQRVLVQIGEPSDGLAAGFGGRADRDTGLRLERGADALEAGVHQRAHGLLVLPPARSRARPAVDVAQRDDGARARAQLAHDARQRARDVGLAETARGDP
jgi:hypothetical protein